MFRSITIRDSIHQDYGYTPLEIPVSINAPRSVKFERFANLEKSVSVETKLNDSSRAC